MIDEIKQKNKTGFKISFSMIVIGIIFLPIIVILLLGLAPFLLIGYIVYAILEYKKETLIPRQKHQRFLKGYGI